MDKDFFEAFKCFEPNNKNKDKNTNSDDTTTKEEDILEEDINYNCEINNNKFMEADKLNKQLTNDSNSDDNNKKLDLFNDKAMERISQILTYYTSWINQIESSLTDINYDNINDQDINIKPPTIGMYDIINSKKYLGNYNNTQLLNDFHHIINTYEYNTIYQLFTLYYKSANNCIKSKNKNNTSKSDKNLCKLLQRNYRNRNKSYQNNRHRQRLYYGYNASTEITTQQILDYIHCFIYHSYELGFKFTPKQTKVLNDHFNLYKQQLIDNESMEHSKSAQTSKTENKSDEKSDDLPKRGSLLYNQKIEHTAPSTNDNSISDDTDSEDSLSVTPQPPEADDEKSDHIKLTPTTSPQSSPLKKHHTYLEPANSSMILAARPNTSKNIKDKQNNNDTKLIRKIKTSNSKLVIMKQIIQQNKLNKTLKKLRAITTDNDENSNNNKPKFVHIISSYKHLSPHDNTDDSKSTQSKTDTNDEQRDQLPPLSINLKGGRHRASSSADHVATLKDAKNTFSIYCHSSLHLIYG